MSFANPTALIWAALAVPIVIFYILKVRLRRVPVSTVMFWRQIFDEQPPRSIWQHLRHLLSLLLQLVFLSLLVAALAEPFFTWEVLEARRLVLVVDNSASMNATDLPPTRLNRAQQAGARLIDGLRFRDEMAIVAAGTEPQVVCGLTGHQRTLHEALAALPGTDGPTSVADAVALGRRLLGDQPHAKVIVLSDGCWPEAEKLAQAADVLLIPFGGRTGNVGITRFQVRRSLLDPIGYQVLAEVVNCSDEPVDFRIAIDLNGEAVDVVPLKLQAGGMWTQVFEKTSAEGGRLVATLEHADALAADNRAWALLPRREMQPVTLVTAPNVFLEKVFEANPLVELTVLRKLPSGSRKPGAITVYHRQVPARLPAGPVFVIDPAVACDLWTLGEKIANPIVAKQDKDSLLMAHVRLDNVLMPEARQLTFLKEPHQLVAALGGEPLYCAIDRPEGKVLVLSLNIDRGDLPLRTAFPILATNALAYLAGHAGELRESLATGAVTEVELGEGGGWRVADGGTGEEAGSGKTGQNQSTDLALWTPGGQSRPLPKHVSKATVGPLDQCGVWSVGPSSPSETKAGQQPAPLLEIACNLANRAESDLRTPDSLLAAETTMLALAGFAVRPIWYYLVAAAWLLTVVEWFLYQRRWIS